MGTMGDTPPPSRHPTDWERQRAQLSASLDGELSAEERAELERHLPECAECQAELADLRRMRELLGALPAPTLPRSFTLPAETTGGSGTRPPADPNRRRGAAVPAWYRASQWVGGVAASIGLVLLLGSALLGVLSASHPYGGAMTTASSAAPIHVGAEPSTPASTQAPLGAGTVSVPQPTPSPPGEVIATPTAPTVAASTHEYGTSQNSFPWAPLGGVGLLAGGLIVLVAGRVAWVRR